MLEDYTNCNLRGQHGSAIHSGTETVVWHQQRTKENFLWVHQNAFFKNCALSLSTFLKIKLSEHIKNLVWFFYNLGICKNHYEVGRFVGVKNLWIKLLPYFFYALQSNLQLTSGFGHILWWFRSELHVLWYELALMALCVSMHYLEDISDTSSPAESSIWLSG